MKKEQKQFLQDRFKQHYVKGWDKLLPTLKQHGGKMMVPRPEPEEHVETLLRCGRLFDTDKLKLVKGEPNSCHANASTIWAHDDRMQLVTGYALTDELWHQHSWVWNLSTGELIETTVPRTKYFGVVLTEDEAGRFAMDNVPEFRDPPKCPRRIADFCAKTTFAEFIRTTDYSAGVLTLFKQWALKVSRNRHRKSDEASKLVSKYGRRIHTMPKDSNDRTGACACCGNPATGNEKHGVTKDKRSKMRESKG